MGIGLQRQFYSHSNIYPLLWSTDACLVLAVLQSEGEARDAEVRKNPNLCTLCEEFALDALNYISENRTQTEIINTLHKSCSKIPSFKQQVLRYVVLAMIVVKFPLID